MPTPDPKELIKKVRRIQIQTRDTVNDLFAGQYHSTFKGRGMEFEEVREYMPGDDIRTIDWNVTAKMGTPFVKQYREERELTILLAIDVSESGTFGSTKRSKRERLAELGALLAFSANRNGDKVGLLLFSDQTEQYLPPNKGQKHVLRILREILFHPNQSKKTDLNEGLRFINRVMRRRAVVFLLSDFIIPEYIEQEESVEDLFFKELAATRRRHDLVCARIHDPCELEIPDFGIVHLEDCKSGEKIHLNTSSRNFREEYQKLNKEYREEFEKRLRRRGVDHFEFSTDSDYVGALQEFFRMREIRRNR